MLSASVSEALSQWPLWQCCSSPPICRKPLLGGLTNNSYLIESNQQAFVLRVFAENSNALDINRLAEKAASDVASKAGLSPRILYLDPDLRYSITTYIDSPKLDGAVSLAEKTAMMAKVLHQLHSIEVSSVPDLATFIITDKAERYWQAIAEQGRHKTLLTYRVPLQQYFSESLLNSPSVLCHNDPIASNFLFDGKKLQFIDWEYAALGNPLIDLVVVIQNLQLSAQQEQVFLAQYSSLAINAKAVTQAKEAMMYIDWLWWLAKGYDTKDESLVTKLTEIEKKLQLLL